MVLASCRIRSNVVLLCLVLKSALVLRCSTNSVSLFELSVQRSVTMCFLPCSGTVSFAVRPEGAAGVIGTATMVTVFETSQAEDPAALTAFTR